LSRKTRYSISPGMKIFGNFEDAQIIRNPVVTTGSFDGVHLGHKTILNRLKILAEKNNGESVLITFHPHPRKVLYPDTSGKDLKLINSQEEKLELLSKAGLDNVIIIEFTKDFAKTTSEQFVKDYLKDILKVKVVVVGFNHHFGFNKSGDYHQLWEMGTKYNFTAEEIPEQEVQHETVSSTLIRQAISEGYIQRANAYLDHYYIITGIPALHDADFLPDKISFYKIPVNDDTKLLPSPGVYAVSTGNATATSRGMAIIYSNVHGDNEVFLHPFERKNIFTGQKTTLFFHKKISGSIEPGNLNLLTARLRSAIGEISDLIY
jgi:riboflavin kinase/FMN adenylyltransferase